MVEVVKIDKTLKIRIFIEIILIFVFFYFLSPRKIVFYLANTPQAHHNIAKSLINSGKYSKAMLATKKALALDDKFAKSYIDLGNLYENSYDYDKAENAYLTALKYIGNDQGNQEIILFNLGSIYFKKGLGEKSWEYYDKVYKQNYIFSTFDWKQKYLTYVVNNDKLGFINCVANNFKSYSYYEIMNIKKLLKKELRKGNYLSAISQCEKYLKERPHSEYSYILLDLFITALIENNETGKAGQEIKRFEKLEKNDINISLIKHRSAYMFYENKKYDLALNYLNEIISNHKLYTNLYQVYFLTSEIYKTKGDQNKSLEILDEAVSIISLNKSKIPYLSIAWEYLEFGKNDLAQKYLIMSGTIFYLLIGTTFFCLISSGLLICFISLIFKLFFKKKALISKTEKKLKLSNLFIFFFLLYSSYMLLPINMIYLQDKFKLLLNFLHLDIPVFSVLLCQLIIASFCIYSLKNKYKFSNHDLGFYSRGFKFNVVLPICLFIVYILILSIVFTFLYYLIGFESPDSPWKSVISLSINKNNLINIISLFLVIGLIGPIAEEIVFRVYLFKFLKKYSNTTFAILFGSAIFALMHTADLSFLIYFSIGIIYCIMFLKIKSIIPCMVTHILHNSTILCIWIIYPGLA